MRDRLPPIPAEDMTPEQRTAAEEIASGHRGAVYGPFVPMLRSAEFTRRAQHLGEYLRYKAGVPERLRELAILITARHWDQAYEWHIHERIAFQAGVSEDTIAELAAGRRPQRMTGDETTVYDFCAQIHRTKSVCDATFERTKALLGEGGLIDLIGICGYYSMLAMLMNVAGTPLPEGADPFALPSPERTIGPT